MSCPHTAPCLFSPAPNFSSTKRELELLGGFFGAEGLRGRENPACIPRMVGADGADSWELGWGWNVAGHCLPSDQAGGVQVQPKKMFNLRKSPSLTPKLLTAIPLEKQTSPLNCGAASSLGLKSQSQQEELEQTFGSF